MKTNMKTVTKSKRAEVIAHMLQRTADVMGVKVEAILLPGSGGTVVSKARNAFIHLVYPVMAQSETAAILGRRTHSTIYGARRRCQEMMRKDKHYDVLVQGLMAEFKGERHQYVIKH